MTTINLTDQLGLDVAAEPAPASALLKYFQQLPSLHLDSLDLKEVGGLTLDEPAVHSLSTGVSFKDPISLGDGGPSLAVSAGAHGSLSIISDASDLPLRGEKLDDLQSTCYVAFGIDATVSANLSGTAGELHFGASPSTTLTAASYSRFPMKSGVTLLEAVTKTVGSFALPARSGDLADLQPGQITKVAVSGKLSLSGSANLLTTANPLASVGLPPPLPAVSVSAGGTVSVGVSCTLEADYELIARKLDSGAVRLGWYHKNASATKVTAGASEGISATLGTTDLFSRIVQTISADAQADLKELASAGVPDDLASDIQAAVKAAAARKLEIAISAQFSMNDSHTATFLYEITPAALTAESKQAVDQALRGDLSGIHVPGLPGVTTVRSIFDDVRQRGMELDINLLGILNYRSISSLTLEGKVMYEPATGTLVITDRATAERIQSTQVNFGADTQKLRHVLAESFLITAAYHGAGQLAGAPALRCGHTYFDLQNSTNRSDMAKKLRTGLALGLVSLADTEPPTDVDDFGRTLFVASTDYDDGLVTRMFLDSNDEPLPHEAYETAGRIAIQFIVGATDQDAVRRRPAIEDPLWQQMKDTGQPGFPALFPSIPAPFVGAITADYSTIQWWADAMHSTAQKLAGIRLWMARHPAATPNDPDFQKQRQDLAGHLRQVAANTREEFGQPWGLIAMNQLVSRGSGAKMLLTGPKLVKQGSRAMTAVSRS